MKLYWEFDIIEGPNSVVNRLYSLFRLQTVVQMSCQEQLLVSMQVAACLILVFETGQDAGEQKKSTKQQGLKVHVDFVSD